MSDATRLIEAAAGGDRKAAADLLPLVYDELRRLAAAKLASEAAGHSLNPTALVHEAYLRLIGDQQFAGRGHFFAAAAEAMRRILIEQARRKRSQKRGGGWRRVDLDQAEAITTSPPEDLLALDEALQRLSRRDPTASRLVELRFFAGLSIEQAAEALGLSTATAYRHWTFARAWLHAELTGGEN
jgi:RNA polymerase sigma factor (TIGR02999 family)